MAVAGRRRPVAVEHAQQGVDAGAHQVLVGAGGGERSHVEGIGNHHAAETDQAADDVAQRGARRDRGHPVAGQDRHRVVAEHHEVDAGDHGRAERAALDRVEPRLVEVQHRRPWWESTATSPLPGKCFAVAATPARGSPRTNAATWRAVCSGSSPNARMPIAGFSASGRQVARPARSRP